MHTSSNIRKKLNSMAVDLYTQWGRNVDAIAAEIERVIPVTEIQLIISDYIATPIRQPWTVKKCYACGNKHTRSVEWLCMNCRGICLGCKKLAAINEKTPLCFHCNREKPHIARAAASSNKTKSELYHEWHCVRTFPSEVHHRYMDTIKRIEAARVKKLQEEFLFLAREDAKPKDQQIAELRAKLYAANKQMNIFKYSLGLNIKAVPEFPYF